MKKFLLGCFSVVFVTMGLSQLQPIIHLPLSGDIMDVSGNGYTFSSQLVNKEAGVYQGDSSLLFVNADSKLQLIEDFGVGIAPDTNFSIALWMKSDQSKSQTFASVYTGCVAGGDLFHLTLYGNNAQVSQNKLWANIYGINASIDATDLHDGAWHHVAVTMSDTEISFYVDGILQEAIPYTSARSTEMLDDVKLTIGNLYANECIDDHNASGGLSDLRIYFGTLSSTQVNNIYNHDNYLYYTYEQATFLDDVSGNGWDYMVDPTFGSTTDRNQGSDAFGFISTSTIHTSIDTVNQEFIDLKTLSASVWIQTTNDEFPQGILSSYSACIADDDLFYLMLTPTSSDASLKAHVLGQVVSVPRGDLINGDWHHVGFSYSEDSIKLYIDGEPKLSVKSTYTAPVIKSKMYFEVGGFTESLCTYDQGFVGGIDEVRLFNRALSDGEMLAIFDLEKPIMITSVSETEFGRFSVFPNPTSGLFFTSEIVDLCALDGTVIMEAVSGNINVSDLAKGVYVLKAETNSTLLVIE